VVKINKLIVESCLKFVLIKRLNHFVYEYIFVTLILLTIELLKRLAIYENNMSIIGKNIRKIRTVKKLSQASFAELFNLARPSVGAYEEERSEPKIETVIQIASYFGISIDSLLTKELTINDLYNFNIHLEQDVKAITHEKKIETDTNFIKSVLVPGDKQIEYIVHLNNRDFLSSLPKLLIPKHHHKNIRAFEMVSDDMHNNFHGLNLGDLVLAQKMNSPYQFVDNQLYVLITKEKIIIRRVIHGKDALNLVPDNPNFNKTEIKKGIVLEGWEVIGYFSQKIEAPSLISERILHLENQFDTLSKRILKLEKRK
jgi:transcriptional regulator with XRE-family HTH domain